MLITCNKKECTVIDLNETYLANKLGSFALCITDALDTESVFVLNELFCQKCEHRV